MILSIEVPDGNLPMMIEGFNYSYVKPEGVGQKVHVENTLREFVRRSVMAGLRRKTRDEAVAGLSIPDPFEVVPE